MDHGADGNSRNGPPMDIDPSVDHKRSLGALCALALRFNSVGDLGLKILLPAHGIYLSGMSRVLQTWALGKLLGVSHPKNAPSDLSEMRSQGSVR